MYGLYWQSKELYIILLRCSFILRIVLYSPKWKWTLKLLLTRVIRLVTLLIITNFREFQHLIKRVKLKTREKRSFSLIRSFLRKLVAFNKVALKKKQRLLAGADPGFLLEGGALVSCSTSTPIKHIVFFLQNTSCIRKPQVISGGGGCAPPAPSP